MTARPSIWVIIDSKVGNAKQALAVANAMGVPYQIKNLAYNLFSFLPNRLKFNSLLGIDLIKSSDLNPPYPDIVISSGRKTAIVSQYIKRNNPHIITIHLMNPDLGFDNFDLVCLPHHDGAYKQANVFYTIGAPTLLDQTLLAEHGNNLKAKLAPLKPPFISLMIGGKTKNGDYDIQDYQWLAHKANEIATNMNATLLITTSRRSSTTIAKQLAESITAPYFLYDWHQEQALNNPYLGFLSLSDYFIVTGDSVSICSEVLATGKPLYIYRQDRILYKKHIKFLDYLSELGYTKTLNNETTMLDKWNYAPLQEAERIKDKIYALIDFSSQNS